MFVNDKVIWKEGLFLQPQHFQQSERFILSSMQARFSAYDPFYFGFLSYEINNDALANNTFTLTQARGVLPDGTYFSIPESAGAPHARTFSEHFSHDQMTLDVFLALPQILPGRPSVAEQEISVTGTRYKTSKPALTDEVYGQIKKEIEVGKANFSILFGNESRDNFSAIPVARLIRSANGQIILDSSFIPPLLRIGASSVLCNQLRSLLEMLLAKGINLSQSRRQLKGGFAEFASDEITSLTLLLTINTFTPVLNQYYHTLNIHPYNLYSILLQFAGALCTFSATVGITQLPGYDHTAPTMSFVQLDKSIREILGADISAGCVPIPLKEVSPATFVAQVTDTKLFEVATFFLGIAADVPERELVVGSLTRIKMSSRNQLDTLIQSAMPGLPLMHVMAPPPNLSSKPGYVYFSLNQRNMFWDTIRATGTIAMYFPNNFPNLKMELLAVTA